MRRLHAVCLFIWAANAQVQTARVEGRVISDSTDQPLSRAHITLRPVGSGISTVGIEGDEDGSFLLHDVAPGRYSLFIDRDGYLETSSCLHGGLRMPAVITIASNDHLTGVTCRLRPWAVIAGKITFEDGEPGVNVRVTAYREFHRKGRHGDLVASAAQTDDLGEYRMHGLEPGVYYIAAAYERAAPTREYKEQNRVDGEGRELPSIGYTTTFYPNAVKLSEAVPVPLDYGQELRAIGIVLHQVRKVRVRGRITSGASGAAVSGASVALQRIDSENGGLPVAAQMNFDKNGKFEIRDVVPGPYLIHANGSDGSVSLAGHTTMNVPDEDIENLALLISPELAWKVAVRVEGGGEIKSPGGIVVSLEPRIAAPVASAPINLDGFTIAVRGDNVYDVYIRNLPDDFYLVAVRVNGTDVTAAGLDGGFASLDKPLELVLDSRGGRVAGVVTGADDQIWSGASMALIPDPPRARLQAYQESSADEYGRFQFRGVAPGKYVVIASRDKPPCDYYDPDALDICRAAGAAVEISPAGQQNLMLVMKSER